MDISLLAGQPTLHGELVVLEPMAPEHTEGLLPLHADLDDLDGPLAGFARERARRAVAAAATREDRADWTVIARDHEGSRRIVGEAVLFHLDEAHAAMEFRIALTGPEVFDRGYGSEATRLIRDFALGPLGLHRLSLHVSAANARAIRVYRKTGFILEGRRRQVTTVDGVWVDELDLALLDTDQRP